METYEESRYRVFPLKRNRNYWAIHMNAPHAEDDEANASIEFLQPCPIFAACALLEVSTAVISAVFRLRSVVADRQFPCPGRF
jgi:hypothetical protein